MEEIDNPIEIDVSKYTKESLELILKEADKLANQHLESLSRISNRSLYLFAFYSSLFSFSFFKIVDRDFAYLILGIGSAISILILIKNLLPYAISYTGSDPKDMIHDYYTSIPQDEQYKEYLTWLISSYGLGIDKNFEAVNTRVSRFKMSVKVILYTLAFFGAAIFVDSFI